ncbi:MAG: response regulator [Candidatus Dormibacteria bacterium]
MSHHILVAEDEADIRELLRLVLTGAGHEVETAPDGAAALESAVARPPALLVTDLRMPSMNGLDLIRALRGDPTLCHVPVILFTAFVSSDPRVAEARQVPEVEVVTKGSIAELRRAVARLLGAGV